MAARPPAERHSAQLLSAWVGARGLPPLQASRISQSSQFHLSAAISKAVQFNKMESAFCRTAIASIAAWRGRGESPTAAAPPILG
jgi:hypothetical protein